MGIISVDTITQKIAPVLASHGVRKAILFGSVAKGTATQHSDIDLVVDCELSGFAFLSLCAEIENAANRSADVFRLSSIIPNSFFDNEVRQTGVVIYGN